MARILIVDDQTVVLKMLEALLVKNGHTVTACHDAYDAVDKLNAQPFELVITDAIMPRFSGYDLIKTIRKQESTAGIGVILLTGKREKKDVRRGVEAGADDYVVKPVDEEILKAKVKSLLERKGKSDDSAFTDMGISEPARFALDLKIVGISEIGLSFTSAQPFHPNSKISIESPMFEHIGIESPILRVTNCTVNDPNGFFVRAQFVGLGENSLQPLRVWMRSKNLKKPA